MFKFALFKLVLLSRKSRDATKQLLASCLKNLLRTLQGLRSHLCKVLRLKFSQFRKMVFSEMLLTLTTLRARNF